MANVDIRVGKKDAAFFSANPTLILKDGQFLFNSDTSELFIGDGATQLSALVAINVPPSSGVQSVTGPQVDDTDPNNPIVNPLGLIQIIDLEGFFFTDLATAHAWLLTMFTVAPAITNESFDSGVYYFTVPPNTIVSGYFMFDGISSLPNKVSCIDPLGLLVQFDSGASFVLNSGNHILGNCTFSDTDFIDFSGTVIIKSIVDIYTSVGGNFAGYSTGKFIIQGNIGALETAQYGANFFGGSTATIFVNASKYTSNAGGIQGDLQTAITNGCNVQFEGVNSTGIKGEDIPSNTTTNLIDYIGDYHHITGTTTITSLGMAPAGYKKLLVFDSVLILNNSANIILPGNVSITTGVNDTATFISEGGGVWRCLSYFRYDESYTNYTPSFTGFSTPPTITPGDWRWKMLTKNTIHLIGWGTVTGTSNSTLKTITSPFPLAWTGGSGYGLQQGFMAGVNNGVQINGSYRSRVGGSNIIDCYTGIAGATWNSAGTQANIFFNAVLEIEI